MKLHNHIFLLFCLLLLISCNQSEKSEKNQLSEEIEDAYKNADKLKEKALRDTNFAHSAEFAAKMEKTQIEIAKKTSQFDKNDILLQKYEAEIKALKTCTDKIKTNPALLKDSSFSKILKQKAEEVRILYQNLKNVNLNNRQKEIFDNLTKQ